VFEYDDQADLDELLQLAEQAHWFSPIVGLEAIDAKIWAGRSLHQPQGLYLDVTHVDRLFGGWQTLLAETVQWFAQQQLVVCVSIADSIGAAWALANYECRPAAAAALHQLFTDGHVKSPPGVLATSLRDSQQDSQQEILTGVGPEPLHRDNLRQLDRLPVECLRLERGTVELLHRLGVRDLGSLRRLPRGGLATRLGTPLIHRLDQLEGKLSSEPIAHFAGEVDFVCEQVIEHPTNHRDTIAEILRQLTVRLATRLVEHGRGAVRLIVRLEIPDRPAQVLQVGLFRASADAGHLTPLLCGALDQNFGGHRKVCRVTLQATLTGPLVWQQPDLFSADNVNHRDEIAMLIDSLACRLGRKKVVAPKMHRDPQPELAVSWRPLTGLKTTGQRQATKRKIARSRKQKSAKTTTAKNKREAFFADEAIYTSSGNSRNQKTNRHATTSQSLNRSAEPHSTDPLRRPMALIHPPEPLEVTAVFPDGPPIQFQWQDKLCRVVRYWGAERIESGWWRGPSQRRDYFRVEIECGIWLWLYRDLTMLKWYLHGRFD
jgi:protein ImuB